MTLALPGLGRLLGSIAGLVFESMLIAAMFIGLAVGVLVSHRRRNRLFGIVCGCGVFAMIAAGLFLGGPFISLQRAACSISPQCERR